MSGNIKDWRQRVENMEKCKTAGDLLGKYGEASRKVVQTGCEIWHYPLGIASGILYTVHVTVYPDQSCRVNLFFEPVKFVDSPSKRRWWQFWKN